MPPPPPPSLIPGYRPANLLHIFILLMYSSTAYGSILCYVISFFFNDICFMLSVPVYS